MSTVQEFIGRVTAALQHPADDTYATTLVVLIILAAVVVVALGLIALGLPSRGETGEQSGRDADGDTNHAER